VGVDDDAGAGGDVGVDDDAGASANVGVVDDAGAGVGVVDDAGTGAFVDGTFVMKLLSVFSIASFSFGSLDIICSFVGGVARSLVAIPINPLFGAITNK
jgi:hypothetical protein